MRGPGSFIIVYNFIAWYTDVSVYIHFEVLASCLPTNKGVVIVLKISSSSFH